MKKLCLSIIAMASILSSSLTLADDAVISGYSSTYSPQATLTATAKVTSLSDFKTVILVTNSSSKDIQVVVPNAINDRTAPMTFDYITNKDYSGLTPIVLKDPNGNQFWSGQVCNHAIINVKGNPGAYITDIDSFCRSYP